MSSLKMRLRHISGGSKDFKFDAITKPQKTDSVTPSIITRNDSHSESVAFSMSLKQISK